VKTAYVSAVIFCTELTNPRDIDLLDQALAKESALHEIIVGDLRAGDTGTIDPHANIGVLTWITDEPDIRWELTAVACLAQAIGDFVIEWHGEIDELSQDLIRSLLEESNRGTGLVELVTRNPPMRDRFFTKFVNLFRPRRQKIEICVGRFYSREVLALVEPRLSMGSSISASIASLNVKKARFVVDVSSRVAQGFSQRARDFARMLLFESSFALCVAAFLTGAAGVSTAGWIAVGLRQVLENDLSPGYVWLGFVLFLGSLLFVLCLLTFGLVFQVALWRRGSEPRASAAIRVYSPRAQP